MKIRESKVKKKLREARHVVNKAKHIVYELLDEPMSDQQKEKVLELFRLLK